MPAAVVDWDNTSRLLLALICLCSSISAGALAHSTHPKYTPHMVLVSFWSLWASVAIADRALDFKFIPGDWIIVNLNAAFTVTVGGWALFAMRVWHEAVVSRKAQTMLANALQHAMDHNDNVTEGTGKHLIAEPIAPPPIQISDDQLPAQTTIAG